MGFDRARSARSAPWRLRGVSPVQPSRRWDEVMVTDEETAREELEAQLETAMDGLRRAVVRLLQDGEVHPHLVVLALARVTGEVGTSTALAGEQDPEELLGDLGGAVRQAGREFREMLEAGALPTAGSA